MKKVIEAIKIKLGFFGAVVLAALVGGLASATVLAAIPDSNGQINTCYNNNTKVLRVTDPAGNCGAKSTALSWSQNGAVAVGNRIQVATGTSGQTLLSVPGFGEFTVADCDDTSSTATFEFTNTSSNTIDFGVPNDAKHV